MTLDNLSNNDRTKWDYFIEMGVIEFLNTCLYFKDKQDTINAQMQLNKMRSGRA